MNSTLSTRAGMVPIITMTLTMVIIVMMWENTDAITVISMCGFRQGSLSILDT